MTAAPARAPGGSRRRDGRSVGPRRHQPPARSPLPAAAIIAAGRALLAGRTDATASLRRWLRREYAAERVVLAGSGTQALALALETARRMAGDPGPVALPAFACFDVATAAVAAGRPVLFYDVDPASLGPDLDSLDRALARGARTVVVAPLYGYPVDWSGIADRAGSRGAVVVEDAAQGHGAAWRGRPLGSLGALSVLSFGRGKGWTGARGGALLLRDGAAAGGSERVAPARSGPGSEAAVLLAAASQWILARPALYGIPASIPALGLGRTRYRDPSPPTGLTRTAAALLTASRAAAAREADARRARANSWLGSIRCDAAVQPVRPRADGAPGFLRLPVRLSRGLAGFAVPDAAIRLGIAPAYPATLPSLPPLRALARDREGRFPGAEALVRELVTVPTHSGISERERTRILRLLDDYAAARPGGTR